MSESEQRTSSRAKRFWNSGHAPGVVLCAVAALALAVANSPWAGAYQAILEFPIAVRAGSFEIAKPSLLWINDGLMALFFLLMGLEIKREFLLGELSDVKKATLPVYSG